MALSVRPASIAPATGKFVSFRVLGPVELLSDGGPIAIGSAKARALLAALLLRANHFVPIARLAEVLWGEELPLTYRSTLHSHVMRLRHLLERYRCAETIRTAPTGYLISASPDTLDLLGWGQLTTRAAQAREDADRVGELMLLTSACGLWTGRVLANVESDLLQREEVPRLAEELLQALERRIDVGLELGRHAEFTGELRDLTARYPYRERFWAQLMEAYCRAGQQSEAVSAYAEVQQRLADDLGIDPGSELQDLHMRILRNEPPARQDLAVAMPARQSPPGGLCQLPIDVPCFTGRRDIIAELTERLGDETVPTQVAVLHGAPAVGKTAVAIRVAYQLRSKFPDGQWFVPLGGSASCARSAAEVLEDLLYASGLRDGEIPPGPQARAALLRARLADRRVLLVLDDAASVGQVESVLPGTGVCQVLVTSRRSLRGLCALYGATIRRLPPLSADESIQLLRYLLDGRTTDVAAARSLTRLCGHLPLALRIAAAILAARPEVGLAEYVSELERPGLLDRLVLPGGCHLSVRAAIASSYDSLNSRAQWLLGVLARQPGDKFSLGQVAATLGMPERTTADLLAELADAGLIDEDGPAVLVPEMVRLFASGLMDH